MLTIRPSVPYKPEATQTISITINRHGRDRMVVGLTTTYAISAYHH